MPARVSAPWSAYPAIAVAGAVSVGILIASHYAIGVRAWLAAVLAATAVAALVGVIPPGRNRIRQTGTLLLTLSGLAAAVCVGGLRFVTFYAISANHDLMQERAGEVLEWTGRVSERPVYSAGRVRFPVRLEGGGSPVGFMVSGPSPPGRRLEACDLVVLRGRVEPLPRPRNPGDFDYGRFLQRKRIYARLYLADDGIVLIGRARKGPVCAAERVRETIRFRLARYVRNETSRAVLQALILGDRRALDEDVRERFARMGLLHLLAVSGLHVMVVGMIAYRLLGPTLKRLGFGWRAVEGIRTGATTSMLLGYMLVTGCPASVVRAVVMATLFLGSTMLQRPSRALNTLAVAATVLLLGRPAHLFEAGFQLSVSAVASILVVVPRVTDRLPPPMSGVGRHVHSATSVTAAATVGTLPFVLYHFGQVGLAGLVLNLPSIPLTMAALSAGVTAVAMGGPAERAGEILGAAADVLSAALLRVAAYGDQLMGWTVIRWRLDEPVHIAAVILITTALAFWHLSRIRWPSVLVGLLVAAASLGSNVIHGRYRPHLEAIFLDVGQGDAAILRLPNGEGVLVDAGPRSIFTDAGARVVVPQLAYHGIRRLSAVVVTHADSDHLGGLPAVLRSVSVDRVIQSGFVHNSRLVVETNRLLDSLGVRRKTVRMGDTLSLSPRVRAYVLHPRENGSDVDANGHSIVLLVRFGGVSMLLTGDVPSRAELDIVRAYGDLLACDLLKVSHHGSRTSSSGAFLSRAAPRSGAGARTPFAVISVAHRNRFGLPDEDVLGRLRRTGFEIIPTSAQGAAWFRSDGRRIQRVLWRPR